MQPRPPTMIIHEYEIIMTNQFELQKPANARLSMISIFHPIHKHVIWIILFVCLLDTAGALVAQLFHITSSRT